MRYQREEAAPKVELVAVAGPVINDDSSPTMQKLLEQNPALQKFLEPNPVLQKFLERIYNS
ncbi:hypothetical protein FOIG_08365 [Fusarium odoratissimum NRRL 54006]|uniref:Uncharacterized protein n=2 Tax=Fusarium oxysporum species complex TaxID=171631 RepID=X0JDN2_FUSO5|nr:uncharacterized protein FOIG_08365 [Fusarium odoratissimum NRRL 54006]EXL99313.1 hypothetical protein FOIG_08365 [Fusarium odoratissimum NRRL 54006]TXC02198.1 hypothetical protein FocTR4_00015774 [Fusarium oxysporum f. sp. cubense]